MLSAGTKQCLGCGIEFESYIYRGAALLRCPSCYDLRQKRPSVVVDRGIDYHTIVKIESLPAAWLPRQVDRNDASCWKQCIKGEYFGASWDGRIDLFSQETIPPQVGDIALFEAVVAVHRRTDIPENPIEIREYVRLSHAGMVESPEKLPRLVWVSAKYKTTLKGLGRQYRYALKGAPLWEKSISGCVRSGRAGGEGRLCIVDEDHPILVVES